MSFGETLRARVAATVTAARRVIVHAALRVAEVIVSRRRGASSRPRAVERILILQLQQVGYTVIFSPALRALRSHFPNAQIDVLGNGVSAQIYKACPFVNHLYVDRWSRYGERRLLPLARLIRVIRRQRYDCVIADVTQRSFRYGLIAFLSGAPVRVGFDDEGHGVFFTHRLRSPAGASFLECNLLAARALGAPTDAMPEAFFYGEEDADHAERLLTEVDDGPGPLVVMHPASNWQSKTWYPERWAEIADRLTAERQARIVFVGTKAEAEYVEGIRALMSAPSVSFAGRTDLAQLGAVVDRCELFVGTDSGPRHIAGALGKPQVTIMSSLDFPHRWTLARPSEIVLRTDPECSACQLSQCGHRRCMDLIDAERAFAACRSLIAHAGVPSER